MQDALITTGLTLPGYRIVKTSRSRPRPHRPVALHLSATSPVACSRSSAAISPIYTSLCEQTRAEDIPPDVRTRQDQGRQCDHLDAL